MVVPRAGQVKATGVSKAFFDESDDDDDNKGFGAGRARAPSAFKKPSTVKPAAGNKKKRTLMMDDDDDDNDFIRKPSVASNAGGPKALPKIPGAKKSVAPPRAPSVAVDPPEKPAGVKALPKLDKPKPSKAAPPPPPPPPPAKKKAFEDDDDDDDFNHRADRRKSTVVDEKQKSVAELQKGMDFGFIGGKRPAKPKPQVKNDDDELAAHLAKKKAEEE